MVPLLPRLFCFALINIGIIALGYAFVKKTKIIFSWLLLVFTVLAIHLLFLNDTPIVRMLVIIATTFTGMKVIAVAEGYRDKQVGLTFKQWFFFASGWAGMRAQPFETLGGNPLLNAWSLVRFGISRILVGLLFIALAHGVEKLMLSPNLTFILVTALLMVGFSLILHFGLFSISAGMWRLLGANTYLLFRQPAKAISLTEFWSKRWNIAFSEMTSVAIFRPVRHKIGQAPALLLSFLFSGLLHELAISVPVKSGYGLPMIYFIIQGVLVLLEKHLLNDNLSLFKNKLFSRAWVSFWLVVPLPLLFSTQFIKQVLWVLGDM